MELLLLLLVVLGVAITAIALKEDKIFKGYNPEAVDRDADGWVQEGTKFERAVPVDEKKATVKKRAAKKAPAKKAPKKK